MSDGRIASAAGRLARLGFSDVGAAEHALRDPALGVLAGSDDFVESLAATADPDLALAALVRLLGSTGLDSPSASALRAALAEGAELRGRLLGVLGTSIALGDHLERHPDHWRAMQEGNPTPPLLSVVSGLTGTPALDALRVAYRRRLLDVAARDVSGSVTVEEVASRLSDLAAETLEAALAIARTELPEGSAPCRLAVVAMGKCGGRELNYVSDVDVIFVAEPLEDGDEEAALATATRLAASLMRACSAQTAEGTIWPVDANLRPEGRSGALVRTLASHLAYYERWAQTWEFQALLKARPVAGRPRARTRVRRRHGPARVAGRRPARLRRRRPRDAPQGRGEHPGQGRRPRAQAGAGRAARRRVLGPAAAARPRPHATSSCAARRRWSRSSSSPPWGYVGRADAAELDRAYRFLRTMEHRIQLCRLRRSHVVPTEDAELRRIARSMGFKRDPAAELTTEWRRHAREVRRLHEKLFYRPLLNAVARLEPGEARLTLEAARARLEALGYADPAGALRHLEALTTGVSRRASIQRTLLPVMLGWFAESPDPDSGLLGFRQVSDALGTTHWYLGLLRDAGAAAERLARVLASSRYATDLLLRAPEAVTMLADDDELVPRSREALVSEALAAVSRHDDSEHAIRAVRALRRRELFRTSVADLLGLVDVDAVGRALSDISAATIAGGLAAAVTEVETARGEQLPTRVSVVAMGRFGGGELGYGSDADVLFVHDPLPDAPERVASDAAHAVANELRRLLALPGPDPQLVVDADLRPRAARDRWCARWRRTPPTTRAGRRCGRARRCSGPTRSPATSSWGSGSCR